MARLLVDDREIDADEGSNLLLTCLENDIYIPNLCYLEGLEFSPASCRLCFVEIEGIQRPVTSCTTKVKEGMVVKTDSPAVRRLQRSALRLLLSDHNVDCGSCPSNKKCPLQKMAAFLKVGLKPKNMEHHIKGGGSDEQHPVIEYVPTRCLLCGRCIHACRMAQGKSFLAFAGRGLNTVVSFYGEGEVTDLPCAGCLECIKACPVSALISKRNSGESLIVHADAPC